MESSSPPEVTSNSQQHNTSSKSQKHNTGSVNDQKMNDTEDNVEENSHFERKKGAKASPVWEDFKEVMIFDGTIKSECIHFKSRLS